MASRKHTRSFNVLFTPEEYAGLVKLSEVESCTKGAIVRRAVAYMQAMSVDDVPTCANGNRCFVAHMHPPPPTPRQKTLHKERPFNTDVPV